MLGGLGGVGGDEAIALTRLCFQNFHIADLDTFDYSNFNRQNGANIETVGKSKALVTTEIMKKNSRSNSSTAINGYVNLLL